jgi:NAD(P)H-dependent FMN reductase
MPTIIAIAGSLRRRSFNRALLENARRLIPDGVEFMVEGIEGIPLYNADDEERSGIPPRVAELKEKIAAADGLILGSPEYNQSLPGPFKNAIDWLSRPPKDIGRVFGGTPVALTGATPGGGGTRSAQNAWLSVFRGLGLVPWFGSSVYVPGAARVFDEDLRLTDGTTEKHLGEFLRGFVEFVEAHSGAKA